MMGILYPLITEYSHWLLMCRFYYSCDHRDLHQCFPVKKQRGLLVFGAGNSFRTCIPCPLYANHKRHCFLMDQQCPGNEFIMKIRDVFIVGCSLQTHSFACFVLVSTLLGQVLLLQFYVSRSWGSERLNNLPESTLLVSGEARLTGHKLFILFGMDLGLNT